MLRLLVFPAVLVLAAFVSAPAQALVTFGLNVGGQSTIVLSPSTTITVNLTMQTSGLASAYGVSIDASGVGAGLPNSPVNLPALGVFPAGAVSCAGSFCGSFAGLGLSPIAAGTYTIGTFRVHAGAGPVVIATGFFNSGVDGVTNR